MPATACFRSRPLRKMMLETPSAGIKRYFAHVRRQDIQRHELWSLRTAQRPLQFRKEGVGIERDRRRTDARRRLRSRWRRHRADDGELWPVIASVVEHPDHDANEE